jgi:aspartate/methionine/tyrosine aminotransferase
VSAPLANALDRLGTETAFEVLARARALEAQGRRVLHLEIGEPGVDTAPHIVEAAVRALRDGHTRYCPAAGLPELREAVADYISRTRGITVGADRVVVAPGAKPFLLFSVLATCNPGDEVIYPDPGFPIYESVIRFAGAIPVPLPLTEERGFAFAASDLADRLSPRTRLVIVNSPGNPTGGVIERALNAELVEVLRPHACYVLADEVYSEILYGGEHDSLTSHEGLEERVILLESASKTFSMTGWRLGYAALPAALVEPMVRLAINVHSCVAPATQLAGVAALTGSMESVRAMVASLEERRDLLVAGLNALPGVRCAMPKGAFYAFPNVLDTGLEANVLADRLLQEAGVALLSGSAFGQHGKGYLRLSTAAPRETIEGALAAIGELLERG